MKSLIHSSRIAVVDPMDYEARSNIMWTATWALNTMVEQGRQPMDGSYDRAVSRRIYRRHTWNDTGCSLNGILPLYLSIWFAEILCGSPRMSGEYR